MSSSLGSSKASSREPEGIKATSVRRQQSDPDGSVARENLTNSNHEVGGEYSASTRSITTATSPTYTWPYHRTPTTSIVEDEDIPHHPDPYHGQPVVPNNAAPVSHPHHPDPYRDQPLVVPNIAAPVSRPHYPEPYHGQPLVVPNNVAPVSYPHHPDPYHGQPLVPNNATPVSQQVRHAFSQGYSHPGLQGRSHSAPQGRDHTASQSHPRSSRRFPTFKSQADDAPDTDVNERHSHDHEGLPQTIIPGAYPVTEDSAPPDSYTTPVTEPVDETKDESSVEPVNKTKDESSVEKAESGASTANTKHRTTLYRIAGVILCIGAGLAIALPLTMITKKKNEDDVFFMQVGNNITGKQVNSYLGSAVDLSASGHRLITTTSRSAKVFELQHETWQQLGQDILLYNTPRDSSKLNLASNELISVAMDESGDYIAAGYAMYANSSGIVHVYSYDDITEDWEPLGMNLTGSSPKELFGTAVSIQSVSNAIRIAVGAPGHENSRGMISVYEWDSQSQSWDPLGSMIQGDSSSTVQELGGSVSLSLDGTVVAGGGRSVANVGQSGLIQDPVVKVFAHDLPSNIWNAVGQGVKPDAVSFDTAWFVELSANGERMVVSNSYLREEDFVNEDPKSLVVQVYELKASSWNRLGENIHALKQGEKSGYLVSFSNDGNTIAMGDSGTNSGGRSRGHAHIYKSINSEWVQTGPDINGEADADRFGFSVALSGDGTHFAIGAPLNRAGAVNAGRVRVFNVPTDKM